MKQAASLSRFVVPVAVQGAEITQPDRLPVIFTAAADALQRTYFEAFGDVVNAD